MPGENVGITFERPTDDLGRLARQALDAIPPEILESPDFRFVIVAERKATTEEIEAAAVRPSSTDDAIRSSIVGNIDDPRRVVDVLLRALATVATPELAQRMRAQLALQSRRYPG